MILANVVVYLLAIQTGGGLFSGPSTAVLAKYGSISYALTHGLGEHCRIAGPTLVCSPRALPGTIAAWQTAFTAMFIHSSMVQLAGNMLFLWIFGPSVERALGRVKYLAFYVLGGLAALALEVVLAPNSTAATVGASGAIGAVLGGYLLLYRRARVLTLVIFIFFLTVIELPALVLLALWFVEQTVFAATHLITPAGSSGAVPYVAHIGGFGFGLLTVKLLATRRQQLPPAVMAH